MTHQSIPLTTKGIPISSTFYTLNPPSTDSSPTIPTPNTSPSILLIFLNGLALPQSAWTPTLTHLRHSFTLSPPAVPIYAVTYDRYGQGSSMHPTDTRWKPERHDLFSAVSELNSLLTSVLTTHFPPTSNSPPRLLFIAHSLGVPLLRLHDQLHPHLSTGYVFIDSNIANTDFVSLLPDPDDAGFDAGLCLPGDSSVDDLRRMRARVRGMFHPDVRNSEGLDRGGLRALLPCADGPKLSGSSTRDSGDGEGDGEGNGSGKRLFLTVIAHDPVAFADEGLRIMGTPTGLNQMYMQPAWDEYNSGLLRLGDAEKTKGVVIAEGASHFVQRDNPACVAGEIEGMVWRVVEEG